MNKAIWKFPLKVVDTQVVMMPVGSRVLSLQMQDGAPCVWAEVFVDQKVLVEREFSIYGTGRPMRANPGQFIGTIQELGGRLVWHVYEKLLG